MKKEAATANRDDNVDYATLKLIDIPVALLKARNVVDVHFPDDGGTIGSVILRAGIRLPADQEE